MSFFQRNSKLLRALPSGWHQPVRPTELQTLTLPTPTCCFVLSVPLLPASQGITTAFGHDSSLGGTCPGTDLVSHRHSLQFLCKIESQGCPYGSPKDWVVEQREKQCDFSVEDLMHMVVL